MALHELEPLALIKLDEALSALTLLGWTVAKFPRRDDEGFAISCVPPKRRSRLPEGFRNG